MENFIALPKVDINSTTPSSQRHSAFHSFLSDDKEQDDATTTAHSKRLVSFLKEKKIDNIIEYNMGKYLWLC